MRTSRKNEGDKAWGVRVGPGRAWASELTVAGNDRDATCHLASLPYVAASASDLRVYLKGLIRTR